VARKQLSQDASIGRFDILATYAYAKALHGASSAAPNPEMKPRVSKR
jgi:hypothetical protein